MKSLFYQNIQNNRYKGYISEYQLLKEIKAHNVILERVELYHDFIVNLVNYVYSTYLGADYISSEKDIEGHFMWALNKVFDEFKEESIDFSTNTFIKEYFFSYFGSELYYSSNPQDLAAVVSFWNQVFTIETEKHKNEFELLLELYERFDFSFSIKNK